MQIRLCRYRDRKATARMLRAQFARAMCSGGMRCTMPTKRKDPMRECSRVLPLSIRALDDRLEGHSAVLRFEERYRERIHFAEFELRAQVALAAEFGNVDQSRDTFF